MVRSTIQHIFNDEQEISANILQFPLDGGRKPKKMNAMEAFVDEIICDKATFYQDECSLLVSDLSLDEQKIFLSYLVSADDYEDFTSNHVRTLAAIYDYREEMQFFINERLEDVFLERMESRDIRPHQCEQTGETVWMR